MSAVLTPPLPALAQPIVDAAFLADPYPSYQALREAGPIHWSDEFFGGAWLLTRHADVELVLRDPRFSAQRTGAWVNDREDARGELADFQRLFARALLFLDAPDHPRIRKVLNAGFRPDVIQRLVPHIEQAVTVLLYQVEHLASFDFIQTVARPLPVRVITMLMGIENPPMDEFMVWSDALATFIGALQPTREQARRAQASLLAMSRYFETLLPLKRQMPGDDLVSRLGVCRAFPPSRHRVPATQWQQHNQNRPDEPLRSCRPRNCVPAAAIGGRMAAERSSGALRGRSHRTTRPQRADSPIRGAGLGGTPSGSVAGPADLWLRQRRALQPQDRACDL